MNRTGKIVMIVFAVAATPALTTLGMEWYNAYDITNKKRVTFIRTEDKEACDWIQDSLPKDAVVQGTLEYDKVGKFTLIPSFAHRRTALGDPMHSMIFETDPREHARRDLLVRLMYSSKNPRVARAIACDLGIGYIYSGYQESRFFGVNAAEHLQDSPYFERVYENRGVAIDRVTGDEPCSRHSLDIDAGKNLTSPGIHFQFGDGFYESEHRKRLLPFRWLRGSATLMIQCNSDCEGDLAITAKAFARPRTIRILHQNDILIEQQVDADWNILEIQNMKLEPGSSELQIVSLDGEDFIDSALHNGDHRHVAFATAQLAFIRD